MTGDYYIAALWSTGFVISSTELPLKNVVVFVFGHHWYGMACDGERGEMWPMSGANDQYVAHLASLFAQGDLVGDEDEVELLLQFVWENEFLPLLFGRDP